MANLLFAKANVDVKMAFFHVLDGPVRSSLEKNKSGEEVLTQQDLEQFSCHVRTKYRGKKNINTFYVEWQKSGSTEQIIVTFMGISN